MDSANKVDASIAYLHSTMRVRLLRVGSAFVSVSSALLPPTTTRLAALAG